MIAQGFILHRAQFWQACLLFTFSGFLFNCFATATVIDFETLPVGIIGPSDSYTIGEFTLAQTDSSVLGIPPEFDITPGIILSPISGNVLVDESTSGDGVGALISITRTDGGLFLFKSLEYGSLNGGVGSSGGQVFIIALGESGAPLGTFEGYQTTAGTVVTDTDVVGLDGQEIHTLILGVTNNGFEYYIDDVFLTIPTEAPTALPTLIPTFVPTTVPTTAAPTAVPTAVPTTAAPTAVPTTATDAEEPPIVIESAHRYLPNTFQKWPIEIAGASCYRVSFDTQSWTPEAGDFVRIFSITHPAVEEETPEGPGEVIRTQVGKRLYKRRLISATSLEVEFRTDGAQQAWGFRLFARKC